MCFICESKDDHVSMDSTGTVYNNGKVFCLTDSMPVNTLHFCGFECWLEFMSKEKISA